MRRAYKRHKYNLRTQIYMYRKTEMSPRYSQGTTHTYHKYNKHAHYKL